MREILTPGTKGTILRECVDKGKWDGTREGYRLHFRLGVVLGDKRRLYWSVKYKGALLAHGAGGTVSDAAVEIDAAVTKHRSKEK